MTSRHRQVRQTKLGGKTVRELLCRAAVGGPDMDYPRWGPVPAQPLLVPLVGTMGGARAKSQDLGDEL